jgi:hypothetical protein
MKMSLGMTTLSLALSALMASLGLAALTRATIALADSNYTFDPEIVRCLLPESHNRC